MESFSLPKESKDLTGKTKRTPKLRTYRPT